MTFITAHVAPKVTWLCLVINHNYREFSPFSVFKYMLILLNIFITGNNVMCDVNVTCCQISLRSIANYTLFILI